MGEHRYSKLQFVGQPATQGMRAVAIEAQATTYDIVLNLPHNEADASEKRLLV